MRCGVAGTVWRRAVVVAARFRERVEFISSPAAPFPALLHTHVHTHTLSSPDLGSAALTSFPVAASPVLCLSGLGNVSTLALL